MEALEWLGIAPDELLVKMKNLALTQSERKDLYQQYAVELINRKCVLCFFTASFG
jgi:glutamyl/glutaminyl-tRNA synthetase